ncbi:MAG: alpha/beta hydrolase [Gammaproteobacteria bacterium]|nr:MAG: alpha/beta hydrolase [Gammaproteobacteria bacterium]
MICNRNLFIDGPAGRLEAIYSPVTAETLPPVLLCHPHPLHGGTMHTKLIYWLARFFHGLGCTTLRFNFRGVGLSEGAWDEGRGEAEDAVAGLRWLLNHSAHAQCWIAAFSFGCYAGLQAMHRVPDVSHFFAVAPAVNLYDFDFLEGETRPIDVIHGTADEIVPYDEVKNWQSRYENIHLSTIDGAGHFFVNEKERLEQAILSRIQHLSPGVQD